MFGVSHIASPFGFGRDGALEVAKSATEAIIIATIASRTGISIIPSDLRLMIDDL